MSSCIQLRIHPSPWDPSKREISELRPDGTEAPCKRAQDLWDEEQWAQKRMGVEKFAVHTYLMQPLADNTGRTPGGMTTLAVEFVDSGRLYLFQTKDGVAQWCFRPILGGVDFGRTATGHDRNLDGFKPCRHSFFFDELVPVMTRTFRSLVALLQLQRPESPMSVCGIHSDWHEHHVVNIYLKNPRGNLNTVCTTHIICGITELEDIFHTLCCCAIGDSRQIAELDLNGDLVRGREWSYMFAESEQISVEDCLWSNSHIIRLLPFPCKFGPSF